MKNTLKARQNTRRRNYERRSFLRMERLEDRMVLSGASPIAVNDLYQAIIDEPLSISPTAGVLANDTDAEGDTLSALLFSGPNHGTIDLQADGSFLYTPEAGFTGTDSFVYLANDGTSFSHLAAVTLQVTGEGGAPVSNDDSYTVEEDAVMNIGFTEGVLANDTDTEGSPLSAAVVTGPTNGTLALNADGSFTYIPNANFTGSDSFTYIASDGVNSGNVATVNLTVTAVNDLPTAVNDSFSTDEDTELTGGSVLANDSDPDGDTLSASLQSDVQHGTLTLNTDGTFSYTPDADFNGIDGFSYLVSDGQGNSVVATATIVVNSVNDSPAAVNDEYTTDEDTALVIAAPGVLGNDTDADGDPLSSILVSDPQHGTLTLNADGSFTYTPDADFNGIDGFSYMANDGSGDSAVATVTITVNPVNDDPIAVNDSYAVNEDAVLTIDAAAGVLANDTDADGDPLTATLVSGPASGTLTLNADGSFSYTPTANFNGNDSFTYSITDGTATTEATVTLTVNPVNDIPEAVNDEYTTEEDTPLTIAAPGVLGNDTDADGDSLSISIINQPQYGTVTLNADGSFTYTPNADYNGVDGFSYVASDGSESSEAASVTIVVNPVSDAPVGEADAYAVDEDAVLTVDAAAGVLANDTDGDGDPLTAALVAGPTNGTLTLNADGSFGYTPNANFSGSDSFTYTATDGTTTTDPITVTITVNPIADSPVGEADAYTVDEDTSLTVDAATGVLANDTDGDGDPLTAALVAGPTNGTLTLNADGSFSYTPNANFSGSDSFTYTATDGTTTTDPITVSITVNPIADSPVGEADAYAVDEDTALTVDAATGVLANDTDGDGDPLTATLVAGPTNGTLTLNADGSFSYTPNANFSGSDSFTYTAGDGTTSTDPITVTITVNPFADSPVAVDDEYSVAEDEVLNVALPGVLANDTDADGDVLSAAVVSGPANGTLTMNADGSFSYTPNAGFSGTDTFTYTASDGTSSDEGTVTITVTAGNDGPTAVADEYTTDQDTALTIDAPGVLGNDTDPEGDALSAAVVSGPANGTLTLNADGSFTYTPTTGFSGADSFTYKASDGTSESEATVTITVNPFQSAPVVSDDAYSTGEDLTLTADLAMGVLANDFDAAGGTLTATLVTGPANGTLTLNADGSFSYVPEANWHGTATFVYEATSTAGGTVQAEAVIIVEPLNDMPVAQADEYNIRPGDVLNSTVMGNDSDIDGDTLTAKLLWGPSDGTLTFNNDGTFTYTPDAGFAGDDKFYYQLNDGKANSIVALVTIHVGAITENQFPVSVDDGYTVETGQTLNVSVPGVLANDTDAEGDPMTAALVAGPANGTLVLNADGSFSYTPNEGFTGSDTFTYQASDGEGPGNVATVTLTVTPEGTTVPIEAENDAYEVEVGATLDVEAPGILANDVDEQGDALTATLVAGPTNGTLVVNADGSFSYTPNEGFTGSDSFTYQAGDGTNVSNIATVSIEVSGVVENGKPSAGNDSYTVEEGGVLEVPAGGGVMQDDSDPDGNALIAVLFTGPANGTVTLNEDGSFTYTPNEGFEGIDSFLYRVFDGELYSSLAAVTIHVTPSDDPDETPVPGDDDCDDELIDLLVAGGIDPTAIDEILAAAGRTV